MSYHYYKHRDGSIVRIKLVSEFGRKILKFRCITPDNLLYGRENSLGLVCMDQHWHIMVRDGFLVRSAGEMYYLHDTPAPKEGEPGEDAAHLYLFDPTPDELRDIQVKIATWEKKQEEYEQARFNSRW